MAVDDNPHPPNAAEALERPGRSSLQTVAEPSKSVMPGNPGTSVSVLVKDAPTPVVSTGPLAVALDETQYERGHGACLRDARTGELTEIADTRTIRRWPDHLQRAVAAGNLHAYQSARDLADELQAALESRAVIDQATGMLIERYELTSEQAFRLLAQASMNADRTVRHTADELVCTGELPGAKPRSNGGRPAPQRQPRRTGPGGTEPP